MMKTKLRGFVTKRNFAVGSKSQHEAIFLDDGNNKYRLRRRNGNPFHDEKLFELIGKTIEVEGMFISENLFEIVGDPLEIL